MTKARASTQHFDISDDELEALMRRHGLKNSIEGDEPNPIPDVEMSGVRQEWCSRHGLVVVLKNRRDGRTSYMDVAGPATSVEAFYRDALESSTYIKRELRAPTTLEDLPDDNREPTPDADRLVERDFSATHITRVTSN